MKWLVVVVICARLGQCVDVGDLAVGLREQSFLYNVAEVAGETGEASQCARHLQDFAKAAVQKRTWALRMLDASGQESPSYLFVNTIWSGSARQCRDINTNQSLLLKESQPLPQDATAPFPTEFYTVVFHHNNTMQHQINMPQNDFLTIGLCMPKDCTMTEFQGWAEEVVQGKRMDFMRRYPVKLRVFKVKTLDSDKADWMYKPIIIFAALVFSATVFLCVIGTWYDYASSTEETMPSKHWVLSYSLPRNLESIFDTSSAQSSASFPVIHGLKAWGMFAIVFLHLSFFTSIIVDNVIILFRKAPLFSYQIILNSAMFVDTFFCMGGFLLSYLFLKDKLGKSSYGVIKSIQMFGQMIVLRLFRTMPLYVAIHLLVLTTGIITDQTYPIQHLLDVPEVNCPKYWWRNMLFIMPFYEGPEYCVPWTWFVQDDMHFYVIGCVILLIALRSLKLAEIIYWLLIVTSMATNGYTTYVLNYKPTLDQQLNTTKIYCRPWNRMGPYFVGALAGLYFIKWGGKLPLTKQGIKIAWAVIPSAVLCVLHGTYNLQETSTLYMACYMAFSRVIWGVGISWLILASLTGHGGVMGNFLSFRGWEPFSRLSYSTAISNAMVIELYGWMGDAPMHNSVYANVVAGFGVIVIAYLLALVLSLMFEAPVFKLAKIIMKPKKISKNE